MNLLQKYQNSILLMNYKADIKAKIKEQKVNDGKRAQEDAAVDADHRIS